MQSYKNFAKDLAKQAGKIMRSNFTLDMRKEWKKDNTPITVTDIAVNKLVIDVITSTFPDHGIIGEEESNRKESEYIWICDPLDGTAAFSHGYPTFVFALALIKNGKSIIGVIYDPILDRLVCAEEGGGAFLNGDPIKISSQKVLNEKSFINLDTDNELFTIRKPLLKKECYVTTLYSALYASLLVACGEFVAEIYEYSNPWDAAAAKIIVEEAGGEVTDLKGNEQRYDREIKGFIASNGFVHNELIDIIHDTLKDK